MKEREREKNSDWPRRGVYQEGSEWKGRRERRKEEDRNLDKQGKIHGESQWNWIGQWNSW